jgi:two-component system sensor histidine kinase AlgZ
LIGVGSHDFGLEWGKLSDEFEAKNAQRWQVYGTFPQPTRLPDWRNFGVMLRVLLGINGWHCSRRWCRRPISASGWALRGTGGGGRALLLLSLGLLSLARDALWRLTCVLGQALVLAWPAGWPALLFLLRNHWR